MKKLLAIGIFILGYSYYAWSQNTSFEFIFSTPNNEIFTDIIELPGNDYLFSASISKIENPEYRKALIVHINKNGFLIDSTIFFYPGKSIYVTNILVPNENNEFILTSIISDTLGSRLDGGISLFRMNEELNVYDTIVYLFPANYLISNLDADLTDDGNVLSGGSVLIGNNTPIPFLYEFNSDFDSLKAKFYLDDYGTATHIKSFSDGTYWFTKDLQRKYQLVDTAFNYISDQIIPEYLTSNFGIIWDSDTSFYLIGDKIYPKPSHNLGFIHQFHPIDTTSYIFNQWGISDTIDFPALWNSIDFNNKDTIFMGGNRNFWIGYFNPWPSWFIILQTDSMLNIRWERFYGGDAYYTMGKIIATNDGGCLVAGTRYDYLHVTEQQTDIIILKLNSEGLITGDEEKPSIKMQEALVFPNPGTNEIRVRVAAQYPESLFRLFDMNGKQILSQQIQGSFGTVNTAFLKPGTFIYRITSDDGLNESGKWVKQ